MSTVPLSLHGLSDSEWQIAVDLKRNHDGVLRLNVTSNASEVPGPPSSTSDPGLASLEIAILYISLMPALLHLSHASSSMPHLFSGHTVVSFLQIQWSFCCPSLYFSTSCRRARAKLESVVLLYQSRHEDKMLTTSFILASCPSHAPIFSLCMKSVWFLCSFHNLGCRPCSYRYWLLLQSSGISGSRILLNILLSEPLDSTLSQGSFRALPQVPPFPFSFFATPPQFFMISSTTLSSTVLWILHFYIHQLVKVCTPPPPLLHPQIVLRYIAC